MEPSIIADYRTRAEECTRRSQLSCDTIARQDWLKLAKAWQFLSDNAGKQDVYNMTERSTNRHVSQQ
jgi:hypothetical protein